MKLVYSVFIFNLLTNIMTGQLGKMHSEEDLKKFKEQVDQTIALGRDAIIATASKAVSDDPKSLIKDENLHVSVYYNEMRVKVIFMERSPIIYLSYLSDSEFYLKIGVFVYLDKVTGLEASSIPDEYSTGFSLNRYIYRATKEKEIAIDKVLALNNTNDDMYHINKNSINTIIRERESFYAIQIGHSYPITYKLDKKSGKIYDYKDPYADFYPSPASPPYMIPYGGEWVEMKE
ncbi:hypothetical protein [Aquimarina addita]